jgi:hypothetical protein
LSLQARFGALYSTSGYLMPDTSPLSKLSSRLNWPMQSTSSLPSAYIDYSLPIIYDEVDSLLSHPSERNAISVVMDSKFHKARRKRASDFRDRLTRDLKGANKGLVDASLVQRAQATPPAFVNDDLDWSQFGPTGHPITEMGVTATARVLDARVVFSPSNAGIGVIE